MLKAIVVGNIGSEPEMLSETIEIPLTKGKVAIVDVCDAHLAKVQWYASEVSSKTSTRWYAVRKVGPRGQQKMVFMHREILGLENGVRVDHRDHDGLNNRRSNLRAASTSQNNMNSLRPRNRAGYRGVFESQGRWRAAIRIEKKRVYLGSFGSAAQAAMAYDAAALGAHGEFAVLNFSREG